jgi:hypothetical protein
VITPAFRYNCKNIGGNIMKKLLGLFSAIGMVATTGSSVVSCFNYKITDVNQTEIDLQIAVADYPTYNDLEAFLIKPYQDKKSIGVNVFNTSKMMLRYINAFSLKSNQIEFTAALQDAANFREDYKEKYKDLTEFYYCVSTNKDTSVLKFDVFYGKITNTATNNK